MTTGIEENCYPLIVRELIKQRRSARRVWHNFRNPIDKAAFNRTNNQLKSTNKVHYKEDIH